MNKLKEMMVKPVGEIQMLITELILWAVVIMFLYDEKASAGMITLLIIEFRHFRYIWQRNNPAKD